MKKNAIIIFTFFFFFRLFWSVDICHAITVKDLYPAATIYSAAARTWSVPALLEAVSSTAAYRAASTVVANAGTVGTLGMVVGAAGIVYGGSLLYDWLAAQTPAITFPGGVPTKVTSYGVTVTAGNCVATCTAIALAYKNAHCNTGVTPNTGYCFSGNVQTWDPGHCYCSAWGAGNNPPPTYFDLVHGTTTANQTGAATETDIGTAITTALNNNSTTVDAAARDAISKAASAFPGGGNQSQSFTPAQLAAIQAALLAAILQAEKDAIQTTADNKTVAEYSEDTIVENQTVSAEKIAAAIAAALAAQGLTAEEIAAAIAAVLPEAGTNNPPSAADIASALASQGLTAAQIAAAIAAANPAITQSQVEAAVSAALATKLGSDVAVPTDPTILMPTKLSLTTVMGSFMTSINNLPMMQTLQGLTINCSGTSSLCLNLPANLGGNVCYDAAGMQGALNMIGSAVLGLTTLFSFVGIFRS